MKKSKVITKKLKKKKKPVSTKTRLRSAIRKVWMYSALHREVLARARRARGIYECEKCYKLVGPKDIEVDHITPATPAHGIETAEDWGYFIWNLLFITVDKLMALCTECHQIKTNQDREISKIVKQSLKIT